MPWFGEGWSRLHRVTDRDRDPWFDDCQNRPGLYRLVALEKDADALSPVTLQRVCGSDASGTIYIGIAGSLTGRVSDLVKQHHTGFASANHKPLPPRLAAEFPPDRLAVCWRYISDKVDRYVEERGLITAYTNTFGEPPPLNAMP